MIWPPPEWLERQRQLTQSALPAQGPSALSHLPSLIIKFCCICLLQLLLLSCTNLSRVTPPVVERGKGRADALEGEGQAGCTEG